MDARMQVLVRGAHPSNAGLPSTVAAKQRVGARMHAQHRCSLSGGSGASVLGAQVGGTP